MFVWKIKPNIQLAASCKLSYDFNLLITTSLTSGDLHMSVTTSSSKIGICLPSIALTVPPIYFAIGSYASLSWAKGAVVMTASNVENPIDIISLQNWFLLRNKKLSFLKLSNNSRLLSQEITLSCLLVISICSESTA